jgi:6-phosphofructokinase
MVSNTIDNDIQLSIESFGSGTIKDLYESYLSDLKNETNVTYKVKKNTW